MQTNGVEKFFLHKLIWLRPKLFNYIFCECAYKSQTRSLQHLIFASKMLKRWKQQENEPKNKLKQQPKLEIYLMSKLRRA